MILAVDLGTTNRKAAIIDDCGIISSIASLPTPVKYDGIHPCYDSRKLKESLSDLFSLLPSRSLNAVSCIVFTGMAEAGLIVNRQTLEPLTDIWPWFDRRAIPLFEKTRTDSRFMGREKITGLPDASKYGIYKFLTLLETGNFDKNSICWMGFTAFAASLLTGECVEDLSIAARTACIDISRQTWDTAFIESLGLKTINFPKLINQGQTAGYLRYELNGIPSGIPVVIGGHDHVCAAHAASAFTEGSLFLSTGTAQVLLSRASSINSSSGLSYGPYKNGFTVLGSIQSAGGSVNFIKKLLYPDDGFDTMISESNAANYPPSVTWYPYLAGSGAPHLNPLARASLLGLSDDTTRADIVNGIYAGIAFETRYLAETMNYNAGNPIVCMGGLTRHTRYMQTLSDVLNSPITIPVETEGTLYGAARLACSSLPPLKTGIVYEPHAGNSTLLSDTYKNSYLTQMYGIYGGK